jgi:ABC-type multidrug transport system ATPase subunit
MLVSTHSIEEAERISSRVGILARGKLKTIGTSDELKSAFGCGLHLVAASDLGCERATVSYVLEEWPRCELVDSAGGQHTFKLPSGTKLSDVFSGIQKGVSTSGIRDWTVRSSNLEEVFISIIGGSEESD